MTRLRYLLALSAISAVALCVPIIRQLPATTYGGLSAWRLWLEAAAAAGLALASVITVDARLGFFLGGIGAIWLLPELAGWSRGPATLTTLADAWSHLLAALVVVAFIRRGVPRKWAVALTTGTLAAGLLGAASRAFLVDPFLQVHCWRRCDANPLAISGGSLGRILESVSSLVVAGCALVGGSLFLLRRGSASRRDVGLRELAVAVVVIGSLGPGLLRAVSNESGRSTSFLLCWVAAQFGALAIAFTTAQDWVLQWRLRMRLRRLAGALPAAPEALTAALRQALRDPSLEIRYWAATRQQYVDEQGGPVDPPQSDDSSRVSFVARRGLPVAAIIHRRSVEGVRLRRALGPVFRLALENEQLKAAVLSELRTLNLSRSRIVERGTLERRRLERNLHDGAQQRVVTVALMTRMVGQRVGRDHACDPCAVELAHRAETLTRLTLEELRAIARGIYPAVLADAGLAGAIMELAEASEAPLVRVNAVPEDRLAGIVESTAFLVIETAVADARERGALTVEVCGCTKEGRLVCDVTDDAAAGPGASVTDLADHVGALTGTLTLLPRVAANRVHLELPCG